MTTIREQLETPIKGRYDVIVCGGGPTGVCAAVAAGRQGARVLLIERMSCLGGMWTSGLVNPLFDQENKGGMIREIVNRLSEKQAWGGFRNISFHYEYMKHLLEVMCHEAGVTVLYNTTFARALTEGNRVTGVVTEAIGGRAAYLGKVIVDSTADASVAASAGCPWVMGDENGECQAMTLMFLVANIPDKYNITEGLMMQEVLAEAYPEETVFILKYSMSGYSLHHHWLCNGARGSIYQACLGFVTTYMQALADAGYDARIGVVCWMQGESDTTDFKASKYLANQSAFAAYLREDLAAYAEEGGIYFIDAGISNSPYCEPAYPAINEAKVQFAALSDLNLYFPTIEAGYTVHQEPKGDPDWGHYDAASELALGQKFGELVVESYGQRTN